MKHTIRSYTKRHGRMSLAQKRALVETDHPNLIVPQDGGVLNLNEHFPSHAPVLLDIGFGMGESLITLASQYPSCAFLGIEVYPPGVGRTLNELKGQALNNARVIQGDIVEVLPHLPKQAFDRIHLFFPDPWPKSRHHKRRLVQPRWLTALLPHLKAKGILHFATDHDDYAEHMALILDQAGLIKPDENTDPQNPLLTPTATLRPLTKYAKRAKRLGNTCHDFVRTNKA